MLKSFIENSARTQPLRFTHHINSEEKVIPVLGGGRRSKKQKELLDALPKHAMKWSLHAFRWVLFAVLLYIFGSTVYLLYIQQWEFLMQIVTYSVGGFFAAFTGFFGWLLAEQILDHIIKREDKK